MFLVSFEFNDFSSGAPHFYEDLNHMMIMRGFQLLRQTDDQTFDLKRAIYAWLPAQDCAGEVRGRARAVLSVLRSQALVVLTAVRAEEIECMGLEYARMNNVLAHQSACSIEP
jgi:hypothetical protein